MTSIFGAENQSATRKWRRHEIIEKEIRNENIEKYFPLPHHGGATAIIEKK